MNIGIDEQAAAAARHRQRGLWVALGSIITVAVLGVAAMEAPKWIKGGTSGAASPAAAPEPAPYKEASISPAANAPDTTATAAPDAAPAAAAPQPTGGAAAAPPRTASSPRASQQGSQAAAQRVSQAATQAEPEAPPEPWHRLSGTPAPSSSPAEGAAPAAPAQPAANREAAELRNQFNELTIRANNARNGLQSFQQQQSRQGLGLRADIREAQTRLDFQMQESTTALQAGDFEAARQSMRYAQNAAQTIEKFLGR